MINRRKIVVLGSVGLTIPLLLLITHPVYADMWDSLWSNAGGQNTIDFLTKYKDYLSYGNFFTVILNSLAWFLIKGIYWITSTIEGLIPQTLNLLDFLNDSGVQGITKAVLNDLVGVLMILTLVFLGFKTVIAKEPPNFKSVGVNIFISAFLILGLPSLMNIIKDISVNFYNDTQSGGNNDQTKSLSWNLIQNNITDLLYVSSKGFTILDNPSSKKNSMTPDTFYTSNLSELITPDVVNKATGDEIKNLAYRLDTDENGNPIADRIQGGAFSFISPSFNEGYFRYQVKFIPVITGLIALAIAYIFAAFVLLSTIIEIGVKQIVANLVFATDLETGQKTKMVVQDILNAFMLIAFTGLNFRIYTAFLTFLGTKNLNIIIYVIALISATFFLIRGSNTVMRYFGVDVGLKDGIGQMAGALAVGGAAFRSGKAAFNGAKKAGQFAKNGMKSNQGESENANDAADQLKQKGEDGIKSINDGKANGTGSKLKGMSGKSMNGFGSTLKDKLGGGLKNSINSATPTAAGDEIGMAAATGAINAGKNTLGNMNNGSAGRKSRAAAFGASEIQEGQNQAAAARNSINGNRSAGANKSVRDEAGTGATGITRDVLTNMRLKDAMDPQKNFEGNMRLNSNVNTSNASINQGSTQGARTSPGNQQSLRQDIEMKPNSSSMSGSAMRQTVTQDVRAGATNSNSLRQEILQDVKKGAAGSDSVRQTVLQDVKAGANGSNPVRQTVMQDIKTSSAGSSQTRQVIQQDVRASGSISSNPARQTVLQDVKAGTANTGPVRQDIIQDVKAGSTPNNTVRQSVIQDIQQGKMNMNPARQEVTQDIKRVVLGNSPTPAQSVVQSVSASGPNRQTVIQDIQRASSPAAEQLNQTVRQTVETTNRQQSAIIEQQEVKTKVSEETETRQKSYFGSLFGEGAKEKSSVPKKFSRFDFITKKS